MNLELLKKLVRLANNNPNDNEANLAARKACKMIADGDFKFSPDVPKRPEPVFPDRPMWDFDSEIFADLFRRANQQYQRARQQQEREPPWWDRQQEARRPYNRYDDGGEKRTREQRDLKCNKCGRVRATPFVGPEFNFTCPDCQWTTYNEGKQNG